MNLLKKNMVFTKWMLDGRSSGWHSSGVCDFPRGSCESLLSISSAKKRSRNKNVFVQIFNGISPLLMPFSTKWNIFASKSHSNKYTSSARVLVLRRLVKDVNHRNWYRMRLCATSIAKGCGRPHTKHTWICKTVRASDSQLEIRTGINVRNLNGHHVYGKIE